MIYKYYIVCEIDGGCGNKQGNGLIFSYILIFTLNIIFDYIFLFLSKFERKRGIKSKRLVLWVVIDSLVFIFLIVGLVFGNTSIFGIILITIVFKSINTFFLIGIIQK